MVVDQADTPPDPSSGLTRVWHRFSYRNDPLLSPRHRRAVLLMAVFAPFAVLGLWGFAAFYLIHDIARLWPAALTCLLGGVGFLLLPRFIRRAVVFGCFAMLALGGVMFSVLCYLMGSQSGLNLGYFTGAVLGLMLLGTKRPLILAVIIGPALVLGLVMPFVFPDPALSGVTPNLQRFIFQSNVLTLLVITILALVLAVRQVEIAEDALKVEHARSEALLYNLLPTEIAARLKDAPDQTIADSLDHTAILFADIVGFTPRSARMSPEALVGFLNRIFSTFDHLAAKHGLEKIKTIGDAYMVAAGLPQPVDRPVHRVAAMAFDMLEALRGLSQETGEEIELRIGLHAGPVVAGVIGQQKLFYDVWGETVNTASRMESHGQAGRIQVTAAARQALRGEYDFEPRGTVEIKGIGALKTWWLLPRSDPD